jgi:hypothetical protein
MFDLFYHNVEKKNRIFKQIVNEGRKEGCVCEKMSNNE